MPDRKKLLVALVCGIGTAAVAPTAGALDAPSDQDKQLQEVVVTAQRRDEKLSDVPMSVQVFTQENFDQQGLRSIDDLARVAPGITFTRSGSSQSSNYNDENSDISIRGVDSNAGAPTTGIYLDNTPITIRQLLSNPAPYPVLFDLERVEVLKGPQGTLFGAGSEGGTVRFITPDPSLTTYSGYTRAEFGQIDGGGRNYEAGAAVGGPIIDGVLGFRVSASFREDGGWVDRVDFARPPSTQVPCTGCYPVPNATVYSGLPTVTDVTERNANWHDAQTFRAALRWQPTDNLTIDPSIYVQTLHFNDTSAYWAGLSDPANNVYNNGNAGRDSSTDPWSISAIKITWNLPWVSLNSNTSYFRRHQSSNSDYSQWISTQFLSNQYPPPGMTAFALFGDHQTNFTQELRLSSVDSESKLQWTAGIYYAHAYEDTSADIFGIVASPLTPNYQTYNAPTNSALDKQLAAFGDVSYKFADGFSLTGGLRYSRLEYLFSAHSTSYGLFGTGVPTDPTPVVTTTSSSGNSNPVTPRFVLKYQPDRDSLYYASAAKGFRAGEAQAPLSAENVKLCNGLQIPTNIAPDSIWQYELGAKNALLDHRLQLDTAIFYYQWKDIQQTAYLTCSGGSFAANFGEAVGKGADFTATWRATNDLTLGLVAAYTDAVYTKVASLGSLQGNKVVSVGDHLPVAPWNMNANAEYIWSALATKPYLRAEYQFNTAQQSLTQYNDPANHPFSDQTLPNLPETRVLLLRAGVRFNGMDLSVFAQNALNYHTPLYWARDDYTSPINGITPNWNTSYYNRGLPPRTVGLTMTYRF